MPEGATIPRPPRPVPKGGLIGVCAPAGPVEPEALRRGARELEALGFEVRLPDGLLERSGFTAGPLERRRAELQALFEDDDVAAIVCARGGAGAGRLLTQLDPELIAAHPKVFVGYSDITYLHLLLGRLGLMSFHGPMVARELAEGDYHRRSFLWALTGQGGPGLEELPLAVMRPGVAEGRLRGGCLSILAAAVGTPWALEPDPEGTLLFVEDVDEPPYRIDRMLLQLSESGLLARVSGVVFGQMKGCGSGSGQEELSAAVAEALAGLDVPVAFGCPSGHTLGGNVTLPLGARARLECGQSGRLSLLEGGHA